MVGVGQRLHEPTDEDATKVAALWGCDPVHPKGTAYRCMAELLEQGISNPEAKYTNPRKKASDNKRPRLDLSLERADWVTRCSAATTRRDLRGKIPTRVFSGPRGLMPSRRGVGSYRSGSLRGVAPQLSRNRRGGPYSRGGGRWGASF
jgi:hypothetical protein